MKKYFVTLFFLLLIGCKNNCNTYDEDSILLNTQNIERLRKEVNHDYSVKTFRIVDGCKTLSSLSFYKNKRLVEFLQGESHSQYVYDGGKLIKKKHCRFNNCNDDQILVEYFKYNELNQKIGSYDTSFSNKLDKPDERFKQTIFYDHSNRILKEFVGIGTRASGVKYKIWECFEYPKPDTQVEYRVFNSDTISKKTHLFDKNKEKKKSIVHEKYSSYVLKYKYDSEKRLLETQRLNTKEDTIYMRIINEITLRNKDNPS